MKFTVKKDYIIHLKQMCSVDKNRFYLTGIFFENDSGLMVATDGHRLGMYKNGFTTGVLGQDLIIDFFKSFVSQIKKLPKKVKYIELEITDKFEILYEGEWCGIIIDGAYPNWRRVCPQLNGSQPVQVGEIGFCSQYVESFGKLPHLKFYECNGGCGVVIGISLHDNPDFMGVLMPIRI